MVTTRRVWIYAIVLENPLFRWVSYLFKELFGTLYFDPSLAKASLFISNLFNFNVSLLVWIIISVKKIANVFAINFKSTNFNEYLLMKMSFITIYFILDEQGNSWQYSWKFINILIFWIDEWMSLRWSLHGVCLTRSRLSICKYACIVTV